MTSTITNQNIKSSYEKKVNFFSVENLTIINNNHCIIHHLSFSVKQGDIVSLMGPNGSGKTTLLHTLAGIHKEFKGQWGWEGLIPLMPSDIGYLPQRFEGNRLFPLSVEQVVGMGVKQEVQKKTYEALSFVDLWLERKKIIGSLSGGQFQRMLFARLCLWKPPLILLDEPFAGVDEQTTGLLLSVIDQWQKEGRMIIISHHNRQRALDYFPLSLLLSPPTYRWGKTEEVLSSSEKEDYGPPPHCC